MYYTDQDALIAVDAYLRYSDHKQDEGNSIEYQTEEINEYCARNGMYVRNWYIDRATSGKKVAGRDEFYAYVESVKNGIASNNLVVWRTNRFFRNSYESHKYRILLRESKITLHSVTQHIDEKTSSGRMITGILSEIDEYKSAEISEHVTASMRQMVKRGFYVGSPIAVGYTLEDCMDGDKPRKRYIIDEEKAQFVRTAFEMYASGFSTLQIADYLNGEGIKNTAGNPYDGNAVSRLLHNEFYIGTRIYTTHDEQEPVRVEKRHPAIISVALFEAVQDRFMERVDHHVAAGRMSRSKRIYTLTGKVSCGKCGYSFIGKSTKNQHGTSYQYYACSGRVKRKVCDCAFIGKEALEDFVLKEVKKHILSDEAIEAISKHVLGNVTKSNKTKYDKISLSKRKTELVSELTELAQMKLSKEILPEVYNSMKRDKEEELSFIEIKLENLELSNKATIDHDFIRDYINRLFHSSESSDPNVIKALFSEVVDSIIITDSKVKIGLAISFERYVHKQATGFPVYVLSTQAERKEIQ